MNSTELRDIDFEKISRLVYEQCGIHLHDGKKELVKARLGKRLREGSFKSFSDYYSYVTTEQGTGELIVMIDSISTNLTYFFREGKHFEKLRECLPSLMEMKLRDSGSRMLRLWTAGCSTGEEPYSLAMSLREYNTGNLPEVRILATDISTRVLKTAAEAVYPEEKIQKIPQAILRKYFQYGTGAKANLYRVRKEIRSMVEFRRFNLMETPPNDFRFDIIFCRNVMIYFDKKTQNLLVDRFFDCLSKGGYLFVGHSESLTGLKHAFKYIEPSVYRK